MVELAETVADRIPANAPVLRPALPPASVSGQANPQSVGLLASARAALEARRFFMLLPFALMSGLFVNAALPVEPSPLLLGVGGAIIVLALLALRRSLAGARIAALAMFAWAGFSLLPIHGALFGTNMLDRPVYGTYEARVDEILSETPTEKRVYVSSITPTGTSRPVPVRRARAVIKGGPDLSPGDRIAGSFRFSPVPGAVVPGGFDTQFHAYFDGIGAYGNSTTAPTLVSPGSETAPEHIIDAIRRGISARIDLVLPQPSAGIARAIINGDQSAVTDQSRTTMATAGIAHVLSVSGLHLTIVAGGVYAAIRMLLALSGALSRRLPVKPVAAVGGMLAAVGYFAISGGNVAALRSTLMILLVFGAVLFGRRALTMRNVAIAALIVVATDPASVFRPSFQLSFAAVAALVGAYESMRRESREKGQGWLGMLWGYFAGITVTSLVAGAATLLFSVYHFQQTSPLGVLGNLATLPLVGFVMMPAAALAVIAMPFGLEAPFLSAMGWSIDRMLEMAAFVAAWSEHLRASPLLTPVALLIGFAALGWFCFFRDRWRLAGPALAVPLVILFAVDKPPDVLIADTTQSTAIRGEAGLELVAGKSQSFALDVWRETYGDPIDKGAEVKCDSIACIGESTAGFSYAIVTDPAGFAEECGRADLVMSRRSAPTYCAAGAVVDADDLASYGVHWLRWTGQGFEIRTGITNLARPWRIKP